MDIIKLKSKDGKVFELHVKVAKQSRAIGKLLEKLDFSKHSFVIHLLNVNGFNLNIIVRSMIFLCKDDEQIIGQFNPVSRHIMESELNKLDMSEIQSLLQDVHQLDIPTLEIIIRAQICDKRAKMSLQESKEFIYGEKNQNEQNNKNTVNFRIYCLNK